MLGLGCETGVLGRVRRHVEDTFCSLGGLCVTLLLVTATVAFTNTTEQKQLQEKKLT